MSGSWDAPLELSYQYADEDDPEPPQFVDPPYRHLPEDFDPDELLGIVHAYAGQVALADMCLGMLLNALDGQPLANETLFIATSPRGYPLGEHRRVGPCDHSLYGELLHVPQLVRFPRREFALERTQAILQPNDVYSLVRDAYGFSNDAYRGSSQLLQELRGEQLLAPRAAYAFESQQRAIRTPAWFLRESLSDNSRHFELFAKPDDRCEANEVSSRCGEVVELLAAQLDEFQQMAATGQPNEAPLAEPLCDVWR
jgi:arylsulfatase A-like enzyme